MKRAVRSNGPLLVHHVTDVGAPPSPPGGALSVLSPDSLFQCLRVPPRPSRLGAGLVADLESVRGRGRSPLQLRVGTVRRGGAGQLRPNRRGKGDRPEIPVYQREPRTAGVPGGDGGGPSALLAMVRGVRQAEGRGGGRRRFEAVLAVRAVAPGIVSRGRGICARAGLCGTAVFSLGRGIAGRPRR